jgi:SAM-dependent methyltransferase
MADMKQIFGSIPGGEVLDVATGSGGFIHVLVENLGGYAQITGVDTSERVLTAARKAFGENERIRFFQMDAAKMNFPPASFDTVCIANSLHHLADLPAILAEMRRVLKPGGRFVIVEMYRDDQTEEQLTHVLLHHWWGTVDTANGVTHHPTFTRRQILDLVQGLGLHDLALHDHADLSDDPKDPETITYLEGVIDQYQARAASLPGGDELKNRGEELRQRVRELGFHSASALIAVGTL